MSLAGTFAVVALWAVSQAAPADHPVNGAVLGQLEAVLEHCGRVIPASADRYKKLARSLTGDAADKDVAEARSSAEYRDAYDTVSDQLGQLPKEESDKACAEGLQVLAP